MESFWSGMQPALSRDTYAPSYASSATSEAGAVAAMAEERKMSKYSNLDAAHLFTPVAVEMSGVIGSQSLAFLRDLGQCLKRVTGEEKSLCHLLQRVSVAIQRGNAASVMGTMGFMKDNSDFG